MEEKLVKQSRAYKEKRAKKQRRKKIFNVVACLVVFCVTYALILPAITMEKKSYCGQEAHTHSEKCNEKVLICTLSEGDSKGHIHEDSCYVKEQKLVCGAEESAGHVHTAECKNTEQTLICKTAESAGHTHEASCVNEAGENVCGLEESAGHSHGNSCYQITENIVCGLSESTGHTHTEACYENVDVLVCEKAEGSDNAEAHTHTEKCYEEKRVCEKEEHEHELICYSNKDADIETSADWEATLPDELTGVWADDVLAIAKSQLGYAESSKNYDVTEDGRTLGYTRYGDWYGNSYGDWCAMFVSFCLDYADVDNDLMPLDANCQHWIETLSKEKYDSYREAGTYESVSGDLIFFDWDRDGRAQHIGLVVENIPATEKESAKVKTIEGNCYDNVQYMTYEANDPSIMGYGILPENPEENEETREKQKIKADIYTDGTYEVLAEDDKTSITVEGYFAEGVTARAYPVQLSEDLIEGRRIILAYDITLFDKDGNVLDIEEEGMSATVAIEPADKDSKEEIEEAEDCTIYYVPEEGEPEDIDTKLEEDVVSFQTDHFSTYALTVSETMSSVYLNGETGNDNAAGTKSAPVKTMKQALSLLDENGTIYITGTVTINDDQIWDLDGQGVTIRRDSSFNGALITVANGGVLTLGDLTINGGSAEPSSSNIATNSTYASGSAKAPLIVVNSGGRLNVEKGAVLKRNSNQPNSSNNKFVENGYIGLGGAIYCAGTLTMRGGLIEECEAQCGGGVYVENGTFYLVGGTINKCYARDIVSYKNRMENYHKNAGGGVYVGDNSSMTMTGGTVSNNQSSREGGGISLGWLNRSNNAGIASYITTFTMNGGTITGNYATSTGGGLNIAAGRQAFINAGTITYNDADGKEYQDSDKWVDAGTSTSVFSGGGIYIDAAQWSNYASDKHSGVPGKAVINRALITQNTASNSGGGIAACATSVNFVYGDTTNGTAIYSNTSNEVYVYNGSIQLGDTVLGGGKYNWTKSGTTYDNTLTDKSSAIVKAKELATVFITNNSAYLGGGIGCNGLVEIGGEKEESTYINIKKVWTDDGKVEHPDYIEVQVLQDGKPYGDPIRIYKTEDENGNEVWPTFYMGGLPGGHKYTVQEIDVPGYMAVVEQNGQDFVITNKPVGFQVVKKWVDEEGNIISSDLPVFIKVQLYQNGQSYGEPVELNAQNKWSYAWDDLPKKDGDGKDYIYTAKEVEIPDGFYSTGEGVIDEKGKCIITNIKSPSTSISVEKNWADGVVGADSVQIQLYANDEKYGEPITLSGDNKWFCKWDNLPKLDKNGKEIVYEVQELPVVGYVGEVTVGDKTKSYYEWQSTEEFKSGTQMLLVSKNGALAANGNQYLKWVDVSENLKNGTMPSDTSVFWTPNAGGTSAKLKNSNNQYLYYSNKAFSLSSSSSTIVYNNSNQTMSVKSGPGSTYNYFVDVSGNKGSTNTSVSKAMKFTLYERVNKTPNYGDVHYVVTNTERTGFISVNFAKYSVSGSDITLIDGATLELYKQGDGESNIPNTDVPGTSIGSWTSDIAVSDNGGIHTLELESGTYYLIETEVPEGHKGLDGPIVFVVDAETGNVTITQYPGFEGEDVTVNEDGTVDFPIYNEAVYGLPETGGIGTNIFTIVGAILMIVSICVGFHIKRRTWR